ncbi:MAG: hypothetical protein P8Y69_18290, partial [Gammaproteobacteria bacterium]
MGSIPITRSTYLTTRGSMVLSRIPLAALLMSFALVGCSAEEPPSTETSQPLPVPVAGSQRHLLYSDIIGQEFAIDVALPFMPS